MSFFKHIKTYLDLGKWPVTSAVSLTTAAGYVLYSGQITTELIWPVVGIFFLACGSSAINQIQEARYDIKMYRTSRRPIPSGRITRKGAWMVALVYTLTGSIIIWLEVNITALILGWFSLIWYNLVYTNLKRITVYAVIPGSLIGSIPPVIGWVSAGGPILDPGLFIIILFFFSWQIPHFWLLVIKYGDEYVQAGLPSLHNVKSIDKIVKMIYLWAVVTVVFTILLPFTGLIYSTVARMGIWLTGGAMLLTFTEMLTSRKKGFIPEYYFRRLNFYMLLAVLLIILDQPVILALTI